MGAGAEEERGNAEGINRGSDEINTIGGETTEGMIQSSAAVQELSRMAQELREVMSRLS